MLHYTAMASAEAAVDWLCDPEAQVSSHYVVGRDGQVWQLVAEADRAWHAGAGAWAGIADVNSRSIGIEIDNDGATDFPEAEIDGLIDLLQGICRRWGIGAAGVIGHSDCAPGRKVDPGPRFPWHRLAQEGLAVSVAPVGVSKVDPAAFAEALAAAGYTADAPMETLLASFRLRHRPGAEGPLDATDCGLALALARRVAVDRAPRLA